MHSNALWGIVFIIVAVIILWIVWTLTKLPTSNLGPISREEFNAVTSRVNLLWAILVFAILVEVFMFLLYLFGAAKTASVTEVAQAQAAKLVGKTY